MGYPQICALLCITYGILNLFRFLSPVGLADQEVCDVAAAS